MQKKIRTDLKLIRGVDIYRDGSGAPDNALIEIHPEGEIFYVRAGELYELRINPNKDSIKEVYRHVESRGGSVLVERVYLDKYELTDFCDMVLCADKFGSRR